MIIYYCVFKLCVCNVHVQFAYNVRLNVHEYVCVHVHKQCLALCVQFFLLYTTICFFSFQVRELMFCQ